MQYILTEKEFHELQTAVKRGELMNQKLIQNLCTQVAAHKPIRFWGRDEKEPWGCPLSDDNYMEYCDECPVERDCPNTNKRWSK